MTHDVQNIGGITPIESMRDLLEAHATAAVVPRRSTTIELADVVAGSTDESLLVDALSRLRSEPPQAVACHASA